MKYHALLVSYEKAAKFEIVVCCIIGDVIRIKAKLNNLHVLSTEDSESDLGILFKKNLKFDEHIDNTVNKVNRIIGLIKRKFTYMDKDLFLTLYKSLVRSHLDYGNLVFYPTTKKYKQILENAQRRQHV